MVISMMMVLAHVEELQRDGRRVSSMRGMRGMNSMDKYMSSIDGRGGRY
jgi:hypothetical protein